MSPAQLGRGRKVRVVQTKRDVYNRVQMKRDVYNRVQTKYKRLSPFSNPKSERGAGDMHLLGGQRFTSRNELITTFEKFFKNLDVSFYCVGIEKLVYRLNKCLDLAGDYVEK